MGSKSLRLHLNPTKNRLDKILLDKGLASTRSKAQELIRSQKVKVDGQLCVVPGKMISESALIELLEHEHPFVSRGAVKLEGALEQFGVEVKERRALDVGQSTGGFTEILLSLGAAEVVGIEVGHSQLHASLANNPKNRTFEKTDIRKVNPKEVGAPFPLVVVDVSFVSIKDILPPLCQFLEDRADLIVLIKPQFEVEPSQLGGGGVLRNDKLRTQTLEERKQFCRSLGFTVAGISDSKIAGGDGNQETFLHLQWLSSKMKN